jgi:hypothetical protein
LALRLAKHWNQDPNWFYSLDEETKVKVWAEYRLSHEPSDKIKSRQEDLKRARMLEMIANNKVD